MEVPVRVAARSRGGGGGVQVLGDGLVGAIDGRRFPVEAAFCGSEQERIYSCVAAPQLACLLDGCDTSIVVFGQTNTGKTYTLLGKDIESIYNENERGIIPRFLSDTFQRLNEMPERSYVIHLTWMRLVNGGVVDLLGCGLARCSDVNEAFRYLSKGFAEPNHEPCHSVFTVSIEQRWIGAGGILHHRLSTASFCELSSRPEPSLRSLEEVVASLLRTSDRRLVDYERSLLTAMLRDSFGGRAFTWIICCLSTDPTQTEENVQILEFCRRCRGIRNCVTINGFADNDTPLETEKAPEDTGDRQFGLQFAAQQWVKLVSNAEGLFQRILDSNTLSKNEIGQINEWLFLKAECDECLDPTRIGIGEGVEEPDPATDKNPLPRIAEDTEPSEFGDSDDDSDASVQHDDFLFADKLFKHMERFREKTDELTSDRCEEYLHCGGAGDLETSDTCISEPSAPPGRRKTLRPGESLTESQLESLRRAAADAMSPESRKIVLDSRRACEDPEPKLVQRELLKMIDSPVPDEICKKYKNLFQKYTLKQNLISKLSKAIQDGEVQLRELLGLCVAEEQLIRDLTKIVRKQNSYKRTAEKNDINEELKKAKINLESAQTEFVGSGGNTKLGQHVRKCKAIVDHYENRLRDRENGKRADCDNNKKVKKHENMLKAYKKQIEQVKKQIKRDEKKKNTLELELVKDKSKLEELQNREVNQSSDAKIKEKKQHTLKQVSVRISHLDHVLKEKTSDLQKCQLSEDKESMLRREIRNLRKTRECLIDQRCILGHKRKIHRSLSDTEERKLLEYEEAIEAIDTAIEYKNELICGRGQNLIAAGGQRDRGEELLMARLNKLSQNEMRTLLYKYFQKVIDLRTTCVGLEATAGAAQQEAGSWRRRCGDAWAALQHARLAHARRTTTLTARHYHTLNQLMSEMGGGTESDSSLCNGINRDMPLSLEYPSRIDHRMIGSDNMMTQHSRIASTMAKFNVKDNVVEGNARFVDRIQQVARFHQSGIPSQNLKHLQLTNSNPTTKVTRQKNKLVIIQEDNINK